MTDQEARSAALPFVASARRGLALGETKFHIARYVPTGYGVGSFCGLGWDEGHYRIEDGIPAEINVCQRCRSLSRV
jgi:hypothetical protein